jgi:hypothetical protein
LLAGQLAIWDGVVPAKLPGPTADLDAINGVKNVDGGGIAAGTAAGGGMADGGSVLEGGGRTGTAAGASDEYDREDSFLADSGVALVLLLLQNRNGRVDRCQIERWDVFDSS